MIDRGVSVLARLKNKALEAGKSNQLYIQLFCQEEFLRRLQNSVYVDNFVLKGGLLLYTITDFDSRVTVDIDFLLEKIPNSPERIQSILDEIILIETGNDFITFEVKNITTIGVTKKYAGLNATILARIKNTQTTFSIDFGIGDVIIPNQEKREIPTQLDDFTAPFINTYSIETIIAEKLDAILTLMEFSSRMKDYYDIYYIANRFDFDGNTLSTALNETFKNREHTFSISQFKKVLSFKEDVNMRKKWNTFVRKINLETEDFELVLDIIDAFLREPFEKAILSKNFKKVWNANNKSWS